LLVLALLLKMCGVNKGTLYRYCATQQWHTSQGLTPEMLQKCNTHFTTKGNTPMKPLTNLTPTQTMKSTELHSIIYQSTGKFKSKSAFHVKLRQVFDSTKDGILPSAHLLSNGMVAYYKLNEIQANMIMASIDINHLELVAKVFVKVKQRKMNAFEMIAHLATGMSEQQKAIEAKADKEETNRRLVKLEANLKPSDGLSTGSYPMGAIKADQGWKPAVVTLVALLEAYGSPVAQQRGRNKYYPLHETIKSLATIVAQADQMSIKTLSYKNINFVWFK